MASTEDSELKHLRFVKQIAVKFLIVLSNVYEFAKQHSGVIIVSVEKAVVFFVGPVYNILKKLAQQILVFADDKFEKYAPSLAKNLIAIFQSLIDKTIAIVEKLLTIAQPLIGGIPLVGDLAKDLITNPKDIDSIAKENPLLGAVESVAKNLVKEAQATGLKPALKSAYLSFNVAGLPVIAQFCYKAKKQYPQIRCLGKVFLPVVEKLSEWYNKFVKYMVGEGCEPFDYLPLIPINEMKAAYKVVKVANEGLSALGDLAGGLAGLAGGGLSAVGDVAGGLAGLAGGGLSAVGDVAGGLAGMAAGGLSGVGDVAENLAGGLAGMATGGLSGVGDVAENLAGGGLSAVGDVAGGLAGIATGGLSAVGDVAENLAGGGLSAVGDVAENLVGGGLSAVGDVAGGLAGMATGGLSSVGDVAENLVGGGLSAVGDLAGGLAGMATGGLPGVGDLATGLPGIPGGLPGLPSGLPGLPGLPSGLPGLPGGGKSVVGDVAAGLPGLPGSGSSAVGDVAAGLPGGGSPAVGDVAAGGLTAVEDLAAGGLSAVGNLAGGLTGMAGGFMGFNKHK